MQRESVRSEESRDHRPMESWWYARDSAAPRRGNGWDETRARCSSGRSGSSARVSRCCARATAPGRPLRLDAREWAALNRALRRPAGALAYAQNLWDGKVLAHQLATVHDVTLGVRQCRGLFHELGCRQRNPPPVIAKADPRARGRV